MPIFNSDSHLNDGTHGQRQMPLPSTKLGGGVGGLRLAVPSIAVLVTLGLFGYAISAGTAVDPAPGQLASSEARHKPEASFQTLWVLQLQDGDSAGNHLAGKTSVSSGAISGDIAVQAGWIKNFTSQLGSFGSLGSQKRFPGDGANGGRTMLSFEHGSTTALTPPVQLPQFVAAALLGSGPAEMRLALSTHAAGKDRRVPPRGSNFEALQSLSIDFPANGAKIPSRGIPLVKRAAGMIMQLPAGTMVELNGYTAKTSNSIGDRDLSQRRADSVYRALVDAGVSPAMLSAKGFGSSPPRAGAGAATEGRSSTAAGKPSSHERRVEFGVVAQPR